MKTKKEIMVREGPNIRFECEVYEHEREKKPVNYQQIYKLILTHSLP